jgi:hypothetical protein
MILVLIVAAAMTYSCSNQAAEKAASDFARVDGLVRSEDYVAAMELLDSMMVWNQKDYGIVGEAMKRKDALAGQYHKQALETEQARLAQLEGQIPSLARDFRLTPGEAGRPGLYEHRRQTVEASWNRTYLKVNVLENGEIWLTSHYYGKSWIDHTSLRVYDQDEYVLSDTIALGDEWNRKVEDLGDKWESIDFKEGTDAGIIQFISDNYLKSIKVRFNGSTFQYIVMESYDKEAFHKGWQLAQVLKEISGLRQTIDQHRKELGKLGLAAGS